MGRSTEYPPDGKDWTDRAAPILKAIPGARSPRISEIARGMLGNPWAGYRAFWPRWTPVPVAALPRGSPLGSGGRDGDSQAPGPADGPRGPAAGWQDPGLLALAVGHLLPWPGHPLFLCHRFVANPQPMGEFPEPGAPAGLGGGEGAGGG